MDEKLAHSSLEPTSGGELSCRTLLSYSAFRFADVLVIQIVASFLHLFYVTTYGVRPLWIALARPALKGFDAVTDPILGQLSDNTKSRMGRRRPWILGGGIALGASFALFFSPKYVLFWIPAPTASQVFVWYIVAYLLYYSSHTMSVVPYYALGAELSADYNERTRVTGWRHLIALPAIVLAALTYRLASDPRVFPSGEKAGMAICVGVAGLLVMMLAAITAAGTREQIEVQRQPRMAMGTALRITVTNWPFILLAMSVLFFQLAYVFVFEFQSYVLIYAVFDGDKTRYAEYYFLGTFAMVASAAIANLAARRLARRGGKKRALVFFAGTGLIVPIATLFTFNAAHPQRYFVFAAIVVIGATGMDIIPFSLIADVCDLDELESGRRREGAFMGVFNGMCKVGVTLSPILTNLSLEVCGFDVSLAQQGLPQPDTTAHALRVALFVVPAALFALAALCAAGLPMSRRDVDAAQAELARRRAGRSSIRGE